MICIEDASETHLSNHAVPVCAPYTVMPCALAQAWWRCHLPCQDVLAVRRLLMRHLESVFCGSLRAWAFHRLRLSSWSHTSATNAKMQTCNRRCAATQLRNKRQSNLCNRKIVLPVDIRVMHANQRFSVMGTRRASLVSELNNLARAFHSYLLFAAEQRVFGPTCDTLFDKYGAHRCPLAVLVPSDQKLSRQVLSDRVL